MKNKTPLYIALIMLALLILGAIGYFIISANKGAVLNSTNTNNPTPTASTTPTNTPAVTPTYQLGDDKIVISGSLSFPSEGIPAMNVCAIDVNTKAEEDCYKTENEESTYVLLVDPGTYYIYSQVVVDAGVGAKGLKAYYTKCDTYKDSFIPECNPNAGPASDNGKWNTQGFVCYNDPTCKAAFTPLKVVVEPKLSKLEVSRIMQGWYIPCSYETAVCNDASFDVWQDYLK
jgi:hypothetical protein